MSHIKAVSLSDTGEFLVVIGKSADDELITTGVHLMRLLPGCDVSATIAANSAGLVRLGSTEILPAHVASLESEVDANWTPAVIAAYKAANTPPV